MSTHHIYLASSWRNEYQPNMVSLLRDAGHQVYDFRNPPDRAGFGWERLNANWESWTVKEYIEALEDPIAEAGFRSDMDNLSAADLTILLLPSGRSAHTEAAWHRGYGAPVIVHIPEPVEPELMYKMFNAITSDTESLLRLLELPLLEIHKLSLAEREG